ncbi:YdeI/OmpD-associated family protein [Candidatus Woesearchaeota archaeon]|nr:YdeI/OmpD-associated family protein [Candidatus Woesearchaeota archaeon]
METKTITAFSRDDFRNWLKANHNKENKVSIILHKRHTGKPAPTHRELMEEAICFGWIDTIIKRLDENRYIRNFSRRNKNSRWSENTLSYAKKLIEEGKMTHYGMEFYKLGLQRPTHDHGIPKNPGIPDELKKVLARDKKARNNHSKFPPSSKKMIYRWILRAKLPETRKKRISIAVRMARTGKRIF